MEKIKHKNIYIIFVLVGLFTAIYQLPPTIDFRHHFYDNTRAWLAGDTSLYDAHFPDFFNLPHTMLLLIPFAFLPIKTAEALFITLSIIALAVTLNLCAGYKPTWLMALAFINLAVLDHITRGQWEGFLALALLGGYYAVQTQRPFLLGFCLVILAIKPINVMLPTLVLLWAIRAWPYASLGAFLVWPTLATLSTFFIAGLDWPSRYLAYRQVASTGGNWELLSLWGLTMWHGISWGWVILLTLFALYQWGRNLQTQGLTLFGFNLAIVTNLFISSYAPMYHYVLLIAPFIYLGQQNPPLAIAVWLTNFIPLLMIWTPTIIPGQSYLVILWLAYQWLLAQNTSLKPEGHYA